MAHELGLYSTVATPGLRKPVRVLHLTDLHWSDYDADAPDAAEAVARRAHIDAAAMDRRVAATLAAAAGETFDVIALTGDALDYCTHAAVEHLKSWLGSCRVPVCFVPGNHDGGPTAGGWTTEMRDQLMPRFRRLLAPWPAEMTGRWEVGGLQLLGLDNSDYQVTDAQTAFVRDHLATGLPTVLLMHVPFDQPGLYQPTVAKWGAPILMGAELVETGAKWFRMAEPAPATRALQALVTATPTLRAVLTGHVHFAHEEPLAPDEPAVSAHAVRRQFVGPSAGFDGGYRLITFEPA